MAFFWMLYPRSRWSSVWLWNITYILYRKHFGIMKVAIHATQCAAASSAPIQLARTFSSTEPLTPQFRCAIINQGTTSLHMCSWLIPVEQRHTSGISVIRSPEDMHPPSVWDFRANNHSRVDNRGQWPKYNAWITMITEKVCERMHWQACYPMRFSIAVTWTSEPNLVL